MSNDNLMTSQLHVRKVDTEQFSSDDHTASTNDCCGKSYGDSELICSVCGALFSNNRSRVTLSIQTPTPDLTPQKKNTGRLLVEDTKPIHLIINGEHIRLPSHLDVVVGCTHPIPSSSDVEHPDIDLNAFGAIEKGVSRQHIRIKRFCNMLYVTDLGSKNGTTLNGNGLEPHQLRILHNGDELQLGLLTLNVFF